MQLIYVTDNAQITSQVTKLKMEGQVLKNAALKSCGRVESANMFQFSKIFPYCRRHLSSLTTCLFDEIKYWSHTPIIQRITEFLFGWLFVKKETKFFATGDVNVKYEQLITTINKKSNSGYTSNINNL